MSGWVILIIGVVLCFFGVGSIHVAVLASGFGLGWLLADLFHSDVWTSLLIALGSAVIGWILVTLVFKFAAFFVGMITGALIGARLYSVLTPGEASIPLAIVVVVAVSLVFGFLADRYRGRVLLWATAIGGAGLILSSLGLIWPERAGLPARSAGGRRNRDEHADLGGTGRRRLVHPAAVVPQGACTRRRRSAGSGPCERAALPADVTGIRICETVRTLEVSSRVIDLTPAGHQRSIPLHRAVRGRSCCDGLGKLRVMAGGASSALTGLLFVAVSLNRVAVTESPSLRASAAQTLLLLVTPLPIAALLLTPDQPQWLLGAELICLAGVIAITLIVVGRAKRHPSPTVNSRLARIIDRRSPNLLTSVFLAAAGITEATVLAEASTGSFPRCSRPCGRRGECLVVPDRAHVMR